MPQHSSLSGHVEEKPIIPSTGPTTTPFSIAVATAMTLVKSSLPLSRLWILLVPEVWAYSWRSRLRENETTQSYYVKAHIPGSPVSQGGAIQEGGIFQKDLKSTMSERAKNTGLLKRTSHSGASLS